MRFYFQIAFFDLDFECSYLAKLLYFNCNFFQLYLFNGVFTCTEEMI